MLMYVFNTMFLGEIQHTTSQPLEPLTDLLNTKK